jgi:pimeloyl-ACP methyl ester carboxylesterase
MIGESYNINQLAEDFRLTLSSVISNYKRVIFLAHSMGGLIVRQYLLKYRSVAKQVLFIYFYATPTTGSPMAALVTLFSRNPQFGNLRQVKVDEYLGNLQSDWLADPSLLAIPSFCAYEIRKTVTARIVEQESATNLCNRRLDPIDANHIEIVKPQSTRDKPYQAFKSAYLDSLKSTPEQTPTPLHPAARVSRQISGMVTDEADAPVQGAKVVAIGSSDTTVTQKDGSFSLLVEGSNELARLTITKDDFRPLSGYYPVRPDVRIVLRRK